MCANVLVFPAASRPSMSNLISLWMTSGKCLVLEVRLTVSFLRGMGMDVNSLRSFQYKRSIAITITMHIACQTLHRFVVRVEIPWNIPAALSEINRECVKAWSHSHRSILVVFYDDLSTPAMSKSCMVCNMHGSCK